MMGDGIMAHYIAELDEDQEIAAVWVKDESARGPRVFDPQKHVLEPNAATEFFGAPRETIESWIAAAQVQAHHDLTR